MLPEFICVINSMEVKLKPSVAVNIEILWELLLKLLYTYIDCRFRVYLEMQCFESDIIKRVIWDIFLKNL